MDEDREDEDEDEEEDSDDVGLLVDWLIEWQD
jgi:hypothetical protein